MASPPNLLDVRAERGKARLVRLVDVHLVGGLPSGQPLFGDRAHAFRLVASLACPRAQPTRGEDRSGVADRRNDREGEEGEQDDAASEQVAREEIDDGSRKREQRGFDPVEGSEEGNEPPSLAQPPTTGGRRWSIFCHRLPEAAEDDLDEVGLGLQEEDERGDEEADRGPAPERVP